MPPWPTPASTQERTIRSLEEMLEQYQVFRSEWELSHMIPFTKMLADTANEAARSIPQAGSASGREPKEFLRVSMERRQLKVLDLCKLIQPAFTGLADRLEVRSRVLPRRFEPGPMLSGRSDRCSSRCSRRLPSARAGRWSDAAQSRRSLPSS